MTITPQPQPASYWIDLLDELTDGWFSEAVNVIGVNEGEYYTLKHFVSGMFAWSEHELGFQFWNSFESGVDGIHYIQSGQSVIDAAVEFYNLRFPDEDDVNIMMKQVQLYKRCNGIKD